MFGREDAVTKPYGSPPPAPPPEEALAAYSFVPEPPPPPRNYAQPMWRWMLQDVGRRTVGVARVDLIRPRWASLAASCPPLPTGLWRARLQQFLAGRGSSNLLCRPSVDGKKGCLSAKVRKSETL